MCTAVVLQLQLVRVAMVKWMVDATFSDGDEGGYGDVSVVTSIY